MNVLRTPDEAFASLPNYPYAPHYTEVNDCDGGLLRIHHVDEGPPDAAETVLLMHGEPSWSYLYRHMIPVLNGAGLRTVAPDLVGFGRSDKPADPADHTYERQVVWLQQWLDSNQLSNLTLVCQDWGGLIGLRLVASNPDRFRRIVVANTGLPTGDRPPTDGFLRWQRFAQTTPEFDCGVVVAMGCVAPLSDEVIAAYNAPFPDDTFLAGPRTLPSLVPTSPDDPSAEPNRRAWSTLEHFHGPTLIAFSDSDPVTRGGDGIFHKIPGSIGQPHRVVERAGHFLQEDRGPEFAQMVIDFIASTSE